MGSKSSLLAQEIAVKAPEVVALRVQLAGNWSGGATQPGSNVPLHYVASLPARLAPMRTATHGNITLSTSSCLYAFKSYLHTLAKKWILMRNTPYFYLCEIA